ncbi:MAG: hypothetical protein B7X34_03585 [Acidobacteriia bacterium 12-62-4]|nr:MAG: hypothetical protein B7X34_03585 [Acidobacteriia bacterium 12-62-4]
MTPPNPGLRFRSLSRRTLLRGAGVSLALPFLNAMAQPAPKAAAGFSRISSRISRARSANSSKRETPLR